MKHVVINPSSVTEDWDLPEGIRELEIFDGSLLESLNKEFLRGRQYLLGKVEKGCGGIRPLVIFPAERDQSVCFEDGLYECTFVNADFTILPVSILIHPRMPVPMPENWVTEKLKKDARAANRKLKRDAYKGHFDREGS